MSRRPSRSRRRGRRPRVGFALALCLFTVLGGVGALPMQSFTAVDVPRTTATDVVTDQRGIVGLEIEEQVCTGDEDHLVDVTNQFDTTVTVTIELLGTNDESLVIDSTGRTYDRQYTTSLTSGQTLSVNVQTDGNGNGNGGGGPPGNGGGGPPGGGPPGGGPPGTSNNVTFTVDATTGGLTMHAERTRIAQKQYQCNP
ncbi:MAG: hypothetical protein ACQETI_00245 [Halobacteriota archaeon]